jgi:hypothetical protein
VAASAGPAESKTAAAAAMVIFVMIPSKDQPRVILALQPQYR